MVGNRPGVEHDRIGTSILARDLRRYATPRASARSSFGVGLRRTSRPCFIRHRTRHPVGVTYSRRLAPPSAQSWSLDTQARVEWRSAPWRVSLSHRCCLGVAVGIARAGPRRGVFLTHILGVFRCPSPSLCHPRHLIHGRAVHILLMTRCALRVKVLTIYSHLHHSPALGPDPSTFLRRSLSSIPITPIQFHLHLGSGHGRLNLSIGETIANEGYNCIRLRSL